MQKARQMVSEYISKEELKDYLEKNISFGGTEKKFRFYDIIDSLPPADVSPNIHARWESDGHGHIICTACKGAKLNTHRSKFCDSCGAIMDGERQCERCIYHKENGCNRWVCIDAEVEPKGEKGTE